ncbi:MFS transporter [Erwinia phyllosphaerae]|uniref:MFS transporter n=1 Tax=Erwinia phyllosphaerae TaxID=2853256 RepID=UPI0024868710|nr:MFS transporter [Erwinia phyllosphaerae]MBV4365106.1 MFS transporter [Erwinia phyllosphaerae]
MAVFSFQKFIISRGLGALCDQFLMFAVPLAILKSTGSTSLSALSFVIEWIPRVLFFPIAGSLLQGKNFKKIFLALDIFRCVALLAACLLIKITGIFGALTALMALMSLCYVLNFVSIESVIPANVPREDYAKAHAKIQTVEQFSQILGPAIAIVIYSHTQVNGILLVSAVLFLLSAINLFTLTISSPASEKIAKPGDIIKSNKAAFSYLFEDKKIIYLCAMTWIVNIIYGVVLAISPAIILKHFRLDSGSLGVMQSIAALASVILFYLIPKVSFRFGVTLVGQCSLLIILLSGLLLGVVDNYYLWVALYALLSAFDGGFSVYIRIMRSTVIPPAILSRVIGVVGMLNLLSIPLGGLAVSLLSEKMALQNIILMAFALSFVLTIVLLFVGRLRFGYKKYFPQVQKEPG